MLNGAFSGHLRLRVSKKAWPGTILITWCWDTNIAKYMYV
jgi:hypothetical protein